MAPSAPVMVQPSCVHTASTAENALALVRATRNSPATDCTSAAPPTSASGDPAAVIFTAEPLNTPESAASITGVLLDDDEGDEGDDPLPQAESSVATVIPEVTAHASVQKRRRVMRVLSSVI